MPHLHMFSTKIWAPLVALGTATLCTDAASLNGPSPIGKVTGLLKGLSLKIEAQGKSETASYDKFAKWGEDTLMKTVNDIMKGKKKIDDLQNEIYGLKGKIGSLGASTKQLKTDVAENLQGQKDSETVRGNDKRQYESEKAEAQQCIGALKTSIKVLSGKASKFLQNGARPTAAEETQLMSVAADVQGVLHRKVTSQYMSERDLQVVREFVSNPASGMSALQTAYGQNPFGDYAPQSDQIQGILKGLLESFVGNLEKSTAKETSDQKAFDDLMDTKKKELKTLSSDLDKQELDLAGKKKTLASKKLDSDNTKADLKADEALFAETKASCEAKAAEMKKRSNLRDQELAGIKKALAILTSKDAVKAFKGAASLVQVAQTQHRAARLHSHTGVVAARRNQAYLQLRTVASKYQSLSTARIAAGVKSGLSMDKVIFMIDRMITSLRQEDQEDINHRDRCENSQNANSNEKEDLAHSAAVMKQEVGRLENTQKELQKSTDATTKEKQDIEKKMADRLTLRNEEHAEFVRAMEADANAVKIISQATAALSQFYKNKGSAAMLVETSSDGKPKGKPKGKPAPKVAWGKQGGDYGGQKGSHKAVMGALDMIKEDLEKEIKTGKAEDVSNQAKYEKDIAAMGESLKAKKDTIAAMQKELAEMGAKVEDKKATLSQNKKDSDGVEDMTKALTADCLWVKSHFDKRRKKRKAEIAGLQEAKDHLAKAGCGSPSLLAMDHPACDGDQEDDLDMDN